MKTTRKIKMVAGLLFATTLVAHAATTPVTDGLYMELIADNLSLTNGASVSTWTDSINTNALTPIGSGTSTEPTFVLTNTNFNNHATVSFDGVKNSLGVTTLNGTTPNTAHVMMFVVAQYHSFTKYDFLTSAQKTVPEGKDNRLKIVANKPANMKYTAIVGPNKSASAGNNTMSTNLTLFTIARDNNKTELVVTTASATNSGTATMAKNQDLAAFYLGSNHGNNGYANADIAEVLIYDRTLTSNEVVQVNTYLKDKYFDGGAGPGPGLTTPVITSIDFSGGTVSVTATNLSIGSSCVLIRSDDLTGTFTNEIYTISPVTNQVGVLQDTNPPPANAFYKVESTK